MEEAGFDTDVSFCPVCGALLPNLPTIGQVVNCLACKAEVPIKLFSDTETSYTVVFNKRDINKNKKKAGDDEEEGPTVDRKCPKCGFEKMSYAALQLRSADEGQTVFFTCLKCKFKESENS